MSLQTKMLKYKRRLFFTLISLVLISTDQSFASNPKCSQLFLHHESQAQGSDVGSVNGKVILFKGSFKYEPYSYFVLVYRDNVFDPSGSVPH